MHFLFIPGAAPALLFGGGGGGLPPVASVMLGAPPGPLTVLWILGQLLTCHLHAAPQSDWQEQVEPWPVALGCPCCEGARAPNSRPSTSSLQGSAPWHARVLAP